MKTLDERRKILTDRLDELTDRLQGIEEELESHDTKDWEDLAIEREEDEVLERIGLSGQAEIRKIRAALARMDAGDYGICAKCGDDILPERLDILPFTPLCRTCAGAKPAG